MNFLDFSFLIRKIMGLDSRPPGFSQNVVITLEILAFSLEEPDSGWRISCICPVPVEPSMTWFSRLNSSRTVRPTETAAALGARRPGSALG